MFWEWQSEGYDQLAAIRGDFKLVVTRGGKPELYNVVADPAERRDVSASHADLTRQLNDELKAWLETEVARPAGIGQKVTDDRWQMTDGRWQMTDAAGMTDGG